MKERPDPEQLLARLRAEEERASRARLKIFLGAIAGVGKTYAMLVEAHERSRAGHDVVVGVAETHGRAETAALLEGLEVLPRTRQMHRGIMVEEFDLDAALARRPALLLLDELAHTNAPGSRHPKRWQDIEELLAAGIDVYTTLNVQHIESVIDVVAQITGVHVRETVPDSILDRADEVEVVDLPPDDLLQRLREGKVYRGAQAEAALAGFFRKGNLIALRELALRQTAQRVDAQMERYRRSEGIADTWAVQERILVCVGEPVSGRRLVRSARRMAEALKAEWVVVHVETPGQVRESARHREQILEVLALAEDLGAETGWLHGLRVRDEILAFARARNVSRLIVGKPRRRRWYDRFSGSLVAALLEGSGEVAVYVLHGEDERDALQPAPAPPAAVPWRGYAGVVPVVSVCTLLSWMLSGHLDLSNVAMIYLLGVVVSAVAFGRGPAIAASFIGVAIFDFMFVPPVLTLQVSDSQYLVTFGVMLVVAVVIGTLTARLRDQVQQVRVRAHRTQVLFELSREMAGRRSLDDLLGSALRRVAELFECRAAVLLPGEAQRVHLAAGDAALLDAQPHETGVAQWVLDHGQPAGLGTDTLPGSTALHLPLVASGTVLGVLALSPSDPDRFRDPERQRLLATFANQVAVAIERTRLSESAEGRRIEAETERARNALLSSVSHDLRTPLAVIAGAGSSLRDADSLAPGVRRELANTIIEEAVRLNRLVGDLLDMTRLESGALRARTEWHSLEEVVGSVLVRTEAQAAGRVSFHAPPDLPLVPIDDVLYAQAVTNLVENALRYTPTGSPIEITAARTGDELALEIRDHGPGLPPGGEEQVFRKFWRGPSTRDRSGAGLGLTIARGIAEAHGGRLEARDHPQGGAVFRLVVPIHGEPPTIEPEPHESAEAARD